MAPNGFPGGQAFFFLIPLIVIGAAVLVLTIAVRDQSGRPKNNLPTLPNPKHPLHHVRVSMASTKRKAKVAAQRAAQPPPEPAETPEPADAHAEPPESPEPRQPGMVTGGTAEIRQFRKRA